MASSVIGLIGKTQRKVQFIRPNTGGAVITIDATLSEKHSREAEPTQFEVEDGNSVSDHIILKSFTLELQGLISDTPLSIVNSLVTTAVGAVLPPIGVVAGSLGVALFSALSKSDSPSVAAYGQLLGLQEERKPFNVLTTLKLYKNMWIKSISVPRDANTGKALLFDVTLVQLLLVTPQTVNIVKYASPDLSSGLANKGKQEVDNEAVRQFKLGVAGAVNAAKNVGL